MQVVPIIAVAIGLIALALAIAALVVALTYQRINDSTASKSHPWSGNKTSSEIDSSIGNVANNKQLQSAVATNLTQNKSFTDAVEKNIAIDTAAQLAGNETLAKNVAPHVVDQVAKQVEPNVKSSIALSLANNDAFVKGVGNSIRNDAVNFLSNDDDFKSTLVYAMSRNDDFMHAVSDSLVKNNQIQPIVADAMKASSVSIDTLSLHRLEANDVKANANLTVDGKLTVNDSASITKDLSCGRNMKVGHSLDANHTIYAPFIHAGDHLWTHLLWSDDGKVRKGSP